jgi:hypothetical protein
MILIRVLAFAFGVALLVWAYEILSSIWGYRDSPAYTYVFVAAVPAVTATWLINWSLRRART